MAVVAAASSAKVHPSQGPADPSLAPAPPARRTTVAFTPLAWIAAHAVIAVFLASLWLFFVALATSDVGQFAFGWGYGRAAALTTVYTVAYVALVTLVLVFPFILLLERKTSRALRAAAAVPAARAAAAPTDVEAAKEPARRTWTSDEVMREVRSALREPVALAALASGAFGLLIIIDILVVGHSTVRGSRRQIMGSVIYYVAALGMHIVDCCVLCPLVTEWVWRYWRKARRAGVL